MITKKQEELLEAFLIPLGDEDKTLYRDIAACLTELGYHPEKQRSYMVFKHDLHHKQMAKMGMAKNKELTPFFALRFSACRGYSKRFEDIVSANIIRNPSKKPGCMTGTCHFCEGEPHTHVYTYIFPDGESRSHCGAYALEIPDVTAEDLRKSRNS
jgi:hypothetical protein